MDEKTPKPVKQREKPTRNPHETTRIKFTDAQKKVYFDIWAQYHAGTLKNPRDGKPVTLYIVAKGIAWAAANAVKDKAADQAD